MVVLFKNRHKYKKTNRKRNKNTIFKPEKLLISIYNFGLEKPAVFISIPFSATSPKQRSPQRLIYSKNAWCPIDVSQYIYHTC